MELGEQTTDNQRMTGLFNGTDIAFLVPADDPNVSVPVTFAPTETDNTNHGRATIAAIYVQDQVQLTRELARGAGPALRQASTWTSPTAAARA